MRRIINDPSMVVEDMLKGFVRNHDRILEVTDNPRVLKAKSAPIAGKVGVVTGGGSGHKPAFIGYIGKNMLDAVAAGEIFSSPTAKSFLDAFRAADGGKGIACLYGNYAGDNMNVKIASKAAAKENLNVKVVVANDDVASAPLTQREDRRGVAGEILMWKTAGAKAAQGGSLDEVIAVAQKTIDNTRSIGIGLSPCTIPDVGKPNFKIEEGTMEVGIGHHGEPGVRIEKLASADKMAEIMLDLVIPDLPFVENDRVVVLISGLGATPVMEQYILFNRVAEILDEKKITIYRSYVGNYFTSLEMMGITLSLLKVDDELAELIDAPVETMGLTQF